MGDDRLWTFLFAYGIGLNVLCIVAQLELMRDDLLATTSSVNSLTSPFLSLTALPSDRPMKLLRTFPPLKAREIIPLAVQLVADLDESLFDKVVRHSWDDTLVI